MPLILVDRIAGGNTTDNETKSLSDLGNTLATIEKRLDVFESQSDSQTSDGAAGPNGGMNEQDLMNLARQCRDLLPIVQDEDHLLSLTLRFRVSADPSIRAKITGTAQDISCYLNEDLSDIRAALIYLERQEFAQVDSVIDENTRRWFEVDPTVERSPPSTLEIREAVSGYPIEFRKGTEFEYEDRS
jgi:hypothetical protein